MRWSNNLKEKKTFLLQIKEGGGKVTFTIYHVLLSILSVPDEGYSRNVSCTLNLIFTFYFKILIRYILIFHKSYSFMYLKQGTGNVNFYEYVCILYKFHNKYKIVLKGGAMVDTVIFWPCRFDVKNENTNS